MKKAKAKRYRRTKAEMAAARARKAGGTEEKPKRHRRTKEEMAQVNLAKRMAGMDTEPVFMHNRPDLPIHDLLAWIKEKYEHNRGLRAVDRVLQLVVEYEKLLVEVTAYRHGLKV